DNHNRADDPNISAGQISSVTVGVDVDGAIVAQGAGTIGTIDITGDLSGVIYVPQDPALPPGESGSIDSISVGGDINLIDADTPKIGRASCRERDMTGDVNGMIEKIEDPAAPDVTGMLDDRQGEGGI